jgi:hypothetical protein
MNTDDEAVVLVEQLRRLLGQYERRIENARRALAAYEASVAGSARVVRGGERPDRRYEARTTAHAPS